MELASDILVAVVSVAVVAWFIVGGVGHFRSKTMPVGAMVISLVVLLTTANMLALTLLFPQPIWAQLAGVVIELGSAVLFYSALRASRRAGLRYAFDVEGPDSLVTHGPYRFIRHPFYASYVLFTGGWAIASWTFWGFLNFVVLTIMYIIAARVEEQKFATGPLADQYAEYRRRAGLFWPKLI